MSVLLLALCSPRSGQATARNNNDLYFEKETRLASPCGHLNRDIQVSYTCSNRGKKARNRQEELEGAGRGGGGDKEKKEAWNILIELLPQGSCYTLVMYRTKSPINGCVTEIWRSNVYEMLFACQLPLKRIIIRAVTTPGYALIY